jgi:type II secretory pathway component PulF
MSTEALILLGGFAAAYTPVSLSAFLILIRRRAGWLGMFAAFLFSLYLLVAGFIITGPGVVLLSAMLMVPAGLLIYAYRRYRQGRQEEVFQVMATAVEANMPLAPALRAYLLDRPSDGRILWDAALMLICPPGYPVWTQRRTFDDRVAHLSSLLAAGAPLPDALRIARGVTPREVTVAAEVGDVTGRLAVCLRRADRDRLAGAWLEVMPRVLYPLLLLFFIGGVLAFLTINIVPKYKRIFADFGMPFPKMSDYLFRGVNYIGESISLIVLGLLAAFVLGAVLVFSRSARWHLPFIGRLFRWDDQGLALRMLGTMFEVGRPATEAIGLLADAPDMPGVLRKRLRSAGTAVHRGEPLAQAMHKSGLLPEAMVPMVAASERTHSVAFALTELGDLLAGRTVRAARRLSLVLAPVFVVMVGALVAFICLGFFMPLIQILTELAQ